VTPETTHRQQAFPILRLPPELRIMIYKVALQDITDPVMFAGSEPVQKPHSSRGALALLRTSKFVQIESYHVMWHIVHNHNATLLDAQRVHLELYDELGMATQPKSIYKRYDDNWHRIDRQQTCMNVVRHALRDARTVMDADSLAEHERRLKHLPLNLCTRGSNDKCID